jgi:hypothetical protein
VTFDERVVMIGDALRAATEGLRASAAAMHGMCAKIEQIEKRLESLEQWREDKRNGQS